MKDCAFFTSLITKMKMSIRLSCVCVCSLLKALDGAQIRPFDRAAADLSPRLLCIWLQPRLTVEAAHRLINHNPMLMINGTL